MLLSTRSPTGCSIASTPCSAGRRTTRTAIRSPATGDAHVEGWGTRLADAAVGVEFRVERVHDWDGPALTHLTGLGVVPGLTLVVIERGDLGGPWWVRFDGRDHAVGEPLARLVHGREVPGDVHR